MMPRVPLALALAAGLSDAASAQELFIVNYSWQEVITGSITPVAGANGVLDPGESARIRLGVEARINGTNAVGQTSTYSSPHPGGTGTVRGLASVVYDLIGDNNATTAHGTWGGFPGGFTGPLVGAPFSIGNSAGTPQPGGASVHGLQGGQFLIPGQSANTHNSNVQVFHGVWTPNSYALRSIHFIARASVLVPPGQHNAILLAYGLGTDPTTGENYDLFIGKYIPTDFGNGLTIPAIPAPASLALLAPAALFTQGRRDRSSSNRSLP